MFGLFRDTFSYYNVSVDVDYIIATKEDKYGLFLLCATQQVRDMEVINCTIVANTIGNGLLNAMSMLRNEKINNINNISILL